MAEDSVSLKCEPGIAEILRQNYAAVTAGYHLDKHHWNTIVLDDSVPDDVLDDLVQDSYQLVLAKLTKAERQAIADQTASRESCG